MDRMLVLEDGTVFYGKGLGSNKEVICEVIFNTSMAGYIETMTDPSCIMQAVVMTYPLIGNYGFMEEDSQAEKPWVSALIVREICNHDSNFRSEGKLEEYFNKYDIPVVYDIDTRALTKILRDKGTMRGLITTDKNIDINIAINKIKNYDISKHMEFVSTKEIKHHGKDNKYNVALIDFGVKKGIIDCLLKRDCNVTVYPYNTSSDTILNTNPDGIILSSGGGNPKEYTEVIKEVKELYDTDTPIFAICLGHQLLALSNNFDVTKLKYGHVGDAHSIKDLKSGKIYVTSQSHSYVVNEETIDNNIAEVNYINVNDKTIEGLNYIGKNIISVQFRPDGCPGPEETEYLFDEFISNMSVNY